MKSGQGRLILRDGTDVPLDFCLATLKDGTRRHGTLMGDLTKVDVGEFAYKVRFVPADGEEFVLLVTSFNDNCLTFLGDVVLKIREHEDHEVG